MALIFNPLPNPVNVQVCGNWFEFKPGQVKLIHNENIAHLMVTDKSYEGLVAVPDSVFEDPNSEETARIKEEARQVGIGNRVRHLDKVKYNLTVSLQRDINKSGLKYDALSEATAGEKKALKELAQYKEMAQVSREQSAEELKKLIKDIDGSAE